MHTLIDFLTHVKGIEYVISVLSIAGFILYMEFLKPKPFRKLVHATNEDLEYLRKTGYRNALRTTGRILAAPFIGLAYVVSLPFLFAYTFAKELFGMAAEGMERALGAAGKSAFFGWRPMEAYLSGKKDKKGKQKKDSVEETDDGKKK